MLVKQDAIYNALPYLYMAGVVLTLLTTNETIGHISGVLLISAALLVFHMRLESRTRRAEAAQLNLEANHPVLINARSQ